MKPSVSSAVTAATSGWTSDPIQLDEDEDDLEISPNSDAGSTFDDAETGDES
jgi:hypothetical protein